MLTGITITASWIPSKENMIADWMSRRKPNSKWNLNPKVFQEMKSIWGLPDMDCSASRTMKTTNVHVTEPVPRLRGNKSTVPKLGKVSIPVSFIWTQEGY